MTDVMPEKIDLDTVRLGDEKLAQLHQLIPEAFTDGRIDFDALRRSLGDAVDTSPKEERFGLRWPGKSQLQQVINQPSVGTLVPQPEESVDWDTTQNVIIEDDNLEVLKLLQKSYAGQVKMIYIDPPYNTGNDFVYPDNFTEGLQTYLEFTGQVDGGGRKMQSNTETTGRYHANWLNMMYPRLYLARNLLRDDGVIFISIDDHEVQNLRTLMNEIFGEENFLVATVWKRRQVSDNRNTNQISPDHEYVLAYGRSESSIFKGTAKDASKYSNPDNDPRGPWMSDNLTGLATQQQRPNLHYVIVNPGTSIEHPPLPSRGWAYSPDTMAKLIQEKKILWPSERSGRPRLKRFLSELRSLFTGFSSWQEIGYTTDGTRELEHLFGEKVFNFPKPLRLTTVLSEQVLTSDGGDILLDFFAGSGPTGHAVMQQNAEDGGNRRYILVQLPEPLDEPKTLDDGTRLNTVADICRERVRRAGRKIAAARAGNGRVGEDLVSSRGSADDRRADTRSAPTGDGEGGLDTGFRAYKLAPSNFRPWDGRTPELMTSARQASFMPQNQQLSMAERLLQAADHIRPDAEDEALLAELLLKIGFDLTTPVAREQMAGKTVYNIENGTVLVCLDRQITLDVIERMAARTPAEIICLDAGFPNDQTKVNAGQIIASHARDEETSIAFKVV